MRKGLASATLLTPWMLWKQRNACVFEGEQHQLMRKIKSEAMLWLEQEYLDYMLSSHQPGMFIKSLLSNFT
jgi:cytolysin (calcineurin-like family phosphatase)